MKKRAFALIFLAVGCLSQPALGQTKFEREYRINERRVPEQAVQFIAECAFDRKVRWYVEESQLGKTIEAKTRYRNIRHSIEFDSIGNILDVEREVKFNNLEAATKEKINAALEARFTWHLIQKTQIQWKADRNTLIELLSRETTDGDYAVFYELVLSAREEGPAKYYEVLLDGVGHIRRVAVIIQRSTNNLQF